MNRRQDRTKARRVWTRRLAIVVAAVLSAAFVWLAACGGGGGQALEDRHFYGPTEMVVEPVPLQERVLAFTVNTWGGCLTIFEVNGYEIVRDYSDEEFDRDVLWLGTAPQDIAVTPDDSLVYITDANPDRVRTVETIKPWTVREIDLELDAARVSIAPAAIDPETLVSTVPELWSRQPDVWFTDPKQNRLVAWDHASQGVVGVVELPAAPRDLQVSRDARQVFVTCDDGTVRVVDAITRELTDRAVDLGGLPGRIVESPDSRSLYVLNIDPPQLHVIEANTWRQTEDQLFFPAALNDMALSTDGRYGFISSDDGYVYYFFPESRRVCGSSFSDIRFFDQGAASNPRLVNAETRDCVTRREEWEIRYNQLADAWEVEGTVSGVQINLAFTGQAYESDRGELRFLIRGGDRHESDGDKFRLQTDVGIAPVPAGATPRGIVVSPINEEEDFGEDRVFVADPTSNSVLRLITFDDENRAVID